MPAVIPRRGRHPADLRTPADQPGGVNVAQAAVEKSNVPADRFRAHPAARRQLGQTDFGRMPSRRGGIPRQAQQPAEGLLAGTPIPDPGRPDQPGASPGRCRRIHEGHDLRVPGLRKTTGRLAVPSGGCGRQQQHGQASEEDSSHCPSKPAAARGQATGRPGRTAAGNETYQISRLEQIYQAEGESSGSLLSETFG